MSRHFGEKVFQILRKFVVRLEARYGLERMVVGTVVRAAINEFVSWLF